MVRILEKADGRTIAAVTLFFVTCFIAGSLISYHPQDASWIYASTQNTPIHNICGALGAYCAAFFIYLFGIVGAYICIATLFFIAWLLWQRELIIDHIERIFGCITALIAVCILVHSASFAESNGGRVGYLLAPFINAMAQGAGKYIPYIVLCASSFLIFRVYAFLVLYYGAAFCVRILSVAWTIVQKSALITRHSVHFCMAHINNLWNKSVTVELKPSSLLFESPEDELEYSDTMNVAHRPESIVEPRTKKSVRAAQAAVHTTYQLPERTLFSAYQKNNSQTERSKKEREQAALILQDKLKRFGISGQIMAIRPGPVVTLFEYQPNSDTKLSKIVALEDDLALALQALSVRIIAPIPGTSVVGFEVSNKQREIVVISDIMQSTAYRSGNYVLPLILGVDTAGAEVVIDLVHMPHLLVAGSTGSGKSVALNTMLISLLCKKTPDEMRLILIDPKRIEFGAYADIAHLAFPVITAPKQAIVALKWVVMEMERRYELLAQAGVRTIADYQASKPAETMPYLTVIIDELSDLMMTAGREVEEYITRISQMARAAGIHLIVATQRPSVDVITGLIKVNFPSRISFRVTSKIDSRTILDSAGAEKLLGGGDMLFLNARSALVQRVHGAYVTDQEIMQVTQHIRKQQPVAYFAVHLEQTKAFEENSEDEALLQDILDFVLTLDEVSISLLQRRFKIGYNRSARIIDLLQARGVITPPEAGRVRKVIR